MRELRELSQFIVDLSLRDLPQAVRGSAAFHVLDSVSVALGASRSPLLADIAAAYEKISGDSRDVCLWGRGRRGSLLTGVFLNAMMGHALELDDVHTESKTHIGTVVVPAAWALAEYLGRNGEEFLEAIICGYETMARVGMGFGVSSHRNRGWHVTATAGTFGAAAAAAKLLKLDVEGTLSALGMAGTQSFGLWAFLADGASCKILHPARAATSGVEAALLARSGMTGPEHILDAEDGGLYPAMSDAYDLGAVSRGLGEKFELLYMDNKPYPCCRSTHCVIDAALAAQREDGVSATEVVSAEVATYLVGYKQCGLSEGSLRPSKPVEAKFSTPYTVACALLDGEVSLRQFEQGRIDGRDVKELLAKVKVIPDDRFTRVYPNHWGCELRIKLRDGRTVVKTVADASGSVQSPLTGQQAAAKAIALVRIAYPQSADEIVAQLRDIGDAQTLPAL